MGFFDKLKNGLLKTKSAIVEKIDNIVKTFRTVDEELFEELEDYLAENPENDPPKAGDPTAVYAFIFTLAALPLAGFGVYGWKKRRRAI